MMKTVLLTTLSIFFFFSSFCQKTPKPASSDIPELPKMLAGIGLPYKVVNDTLAIIPYGGEHLAAYDVVIEKVADLYIVYSNLSASLADKLGPDSYKYLLQQNEKFDLVKIGMSSAKDELYLRCDIFRMGITTAILKRVIVQVANVTNIIAGEVK
jgi:hypothetical protein